MERWLTPLIVTNQNLTEIFKFNIKSGHGNMINPPPLSPTRISLKILNLRFNLGHEKMIDIPLILLTSNSLKILNLRFSLDRKDD